MFGIQFYFAWLVCLWLCLSTGGHNFYPCNETVGIVTVFLHVRVVGLVHLKLALINIYAPTPPNRAQIIENSLKSSNHMENANILTLFWASFLYTPSLKSLCQLLKRIWSYSSSSTFSSNLALFRPNSGRGFASCFSRLRLRVFHTVVRYGKRHVKLIETSAEERVVTTCLVQKWGLGVWNQSFLSPRSITSQSLWAPLTQSNLVLRCQCTQASSYCTMIAWFCVTNSGTIT
jgi:hypothetical protein